MDEYMTKQIQQMLIIECRWWVYGYSVTHSNLSVYLETYNLGKIYISFDLTILPLKIYLQIYLQSCTKVYI